jgi:NADH-ubiquinone oxidoreductase chain 2
MPLHKGIGIYGGLFNVTLFTQTFNIFIFLLSAVILILTSFYPRKIFLKEHSSFRKLLFNNYMYDKESVLNKNSEQFRIIEYPLIIVFIICGAVFLVSTGDLVSIFLSIELQSYGLYILCTIYRNSESATESGLTYFLLGGLSSCFILLGSALLYINSGTTNLDNIYVITSISEIGNLSTLTYWYQPHYLHLCLIILSVGFLFKVSAAPFHFWSPDVYDGIPTIVTTYVAIIAKVSVFAFFLELVFYTQYYYGNFTWQSILLLSSLFSLVIGSILGISQFRIKRLYAYSTISHVGFILLALCINKAESVQAYIFYILQYSISNLNAFIILLTIGYSLYFYVYKAKEDKKLMDVNNSPVQLISQVKGYFYINPYLAISLAITLFSFVGVPPLIGFFAKQMVLSAALDNGYIFMAFVAIITSVIAAAYYLSVIKQIFFFKDNYKLQGAIKYKNLVCYVSPISGYKSNNTYKSNQVITYNVKDITISSGLSSTISVLSLLIMLFILMPSVWLNIASVLTLILFKA